MRTCGEANKQPLPQETEHSLRAFENFVTQKRAYSVREFCLAYGIGKTKVYALFASGDLKPVRLGRKNLIRDKEAESWFDRLPNRS